ncbi:uncharacterized protein LOC110733771 [Chenopodium quinoa]|uniref:uncharacterized protein LOC110733771 n=1 Tax=Chenopodium quinoa TaxID=63459 RepID=UPI000B7857B8|nr:uncharacterized protein LOC110733771 [Chenopodium quinoa]
MEDNIWKTIFVTALWHLWLRRNLVIFEQKTISPLSLFTRAALLQLFKFRILNGKLPRKAVSSRGGVIRRSDGTWYVGFSCKYEAVSPLAAELYALNDGLSIAEDMKLKKKFEVVVLTHILRERNELAHRLAVLGKDMAVGYKTHFMVPEYVRNIYEADLEGVRAAADNH